MTKFLIWGHQGWIGQQAVKYLNQNGYETVRATSRADSLKDVEQELKLVMPTNAMSFIGRTHGKIGDKVYGTIDYLEQPGKFKENVRDNLFAPVSLAILCSKYRVHFTYLSTGCIFQYAEPDHPFGQEVNGFTESSLPNFFDSGYSVVKGYTDQLMHLHENNTLNARIRMPITAEVNSRNFITKITTYQKICSVPNSMSVLPTLIPIMVDMAVKGKTGTVNFTNPGLISHNEILEMYRDIVDPTFTWQNFSLEEQAKILAAGRSNNYLDTTLLKTYSPGVPHIKDAVRNVLYEMRDQKQQHK